MDVNSINNNINTLNSNPSSLQLDKASASSKVEKVSDESLNLSINEYNQKRDELSLNVQAFNEGIAVSKIAQNGLDKQQDYLKNIQNKLESLKDDNNTLQDKNEIKQEINEQLKGFNQVAYETKFKNDSLLSVDYYDEKKNIEVSAKTSSDSIDKPNTPDFANNIFETINQSDLNDDKNLNDVIDKVETTSNQLQNIVDKFTEFGNKLESNARDTINDQVNLYNENKINKERNFGNESTDFSSTNVSANAGYLAASQANIVQEQSVRLLS